jgi:RimJ/RimL family protein N-acetyltransferase
MSDNTIVVEEITDYEVINKFFEDEKLSSLICDDMTSEKITYLQIPGVMYVGVFEDTLLKGIYTISPLNGFTYQGHINISPEYWGETERLTRAACRWALEDFGLLRIVGFISEDAPKVLAHALLVGFKIEGVLKDSIIRGGVLMDQTIVSISKDTLVKKEKGE